ncbi:Fc.00g079450.m01.CDS01 [Cosmosporella sp. VM-42]
MKTPDLSQYHDPIDSRDRRTPTSRNTSWPKQAQTFLLFLRWALGIARADDQQLLFSISIGVAYSQRVWQILRDKSFSLGAIDGLFSMKNDPLQFLNPEILARASTCTAIAAVSWALVLVLLFVPASISVVPATRTERNASFPTYTLNFSKSFEELQYRNSTPIVPLQLSQLTGSGANYDGYMDATKGATGLIYNTMYSKRIVEAPSPCGANCSFTQTFNAPAYKCDNVDYNNISADNPFCGKDDGTPAEERCEAMFNLPTRQYIRDSGTRLATRAAIYATGTEAIHPCARHLSRGKTENCGLGIGISGSSIVTRQWNADTTRHQSPTKPGSFRCSCEDNAQLANSALVEETPFPLDSPSSFRPIGTAKPVRHLRQVIQDLHFNITISLLSLAPQLLYTEDGTVTAEMFTTENVWSYSPRVLVATYAAAALFDTVAVIIGLLAMAPNKGVYGLEFSRIVATTRASSRLDSLVVEWGDGLEPAAKEIQKRKLMYGAIGNGG